MYKGAVLPKNYNDLTLAQKEAFWIGILLVYEECLYFDEDYWVDEIVNCSEIALYEDEYVIFYKCYDSEYKLMFKNTNETCTGVFKDFFTTDECDDYYSLGRLSREYKNWSVRDYLREKGFPVNAEFWE